MSSIDNKPLPEEEPQEFHANLKQLMLKLYQVAEGDYTQRSVGLGELSDAFNKMAEQLTERERLLKEKLADAQSHAEAAEGYNELLVELLSRRNEWLLVVDIDSKEIVYCNKKKAEGNCAAVFLQNLQEPPFLSKRAFEMGR